MQCKICFKEIQRWTRHIEGKHKVSLQDYYDQYHKTDNDGVCKNCGKETEFYPRFFKYKDWCEVGCYTRSLWKDPDFIENQRNAASKSIKEINSRLWKDSEFRKRHSDRVSKRLSEYNKRNWSENRDKMLEMVSKNGIKTVQMGYGYEWCRDVYYKDIKMRSSWETKFAQHLDERCVRWEYEPEIFVIGHAKRYIPDFYLPDSNLYIEIKPSCFITEKVLKKIKGLENLGYSIVLVTENNWDEFLEKV